MTSNEEKLANNFNRKSFYKVFDRLPMNDRELIDWVLEIMGIKKPKPVQRNRQLISFY